MAVLVVLVLAVAVAGRAADGEGFSDVGEGGVHRPAIDALDAAGVFEGTECAAGRFCPEDPIPRWVVAVWLVRVLDDGAQPPGVGASSFADVGEGVWWAPFRGASGGSRGHRRLCGGSVAVLSGRFGDEGADGIVSHPRLRSQARSSRRFRGCCGWCSFREYRGSGGCGDHCRLWGGSVAVLPG